MEFGTGPFGLFDFGGEAGDIEALYETGISAVKDAFDPADPHVDATALARAATFASARVNLRHGANQRLPSRAVELIPALEKTYGTTPNFDDTDQERRDTLTARKLIARGAGRGPLEDALRALLGDAFISLRVLAPSEIVKGPSSPATRGAFTDPAKSARFFRFITPIAVLGTPYTFDYSVLGAEAADRLHVGDVMCAQPENPGLSERVVITAASPTSVPPTATATFARVHDASSSLVSYAPMYMSTQRSVYVGIVAASLTSELWRRTQELLGRALRGVTIGYVVGELGGATGPYVVGYSRLDEGTVGTTVL